MTKLLFSLGLIMGGLALGYVLQILNQKEFLRLPLPVPALRKLLQKAGLLFFMPISFVGAVWIIRIDDIRIVTLPFLCVLALSLGGVLALGGARIMGLGRKQTGAYFACGSFSNLGSIGALVAFVFLGEKGFAIVPLYKLFEETFYYTVDFPLPSTIQRTTQKRKSCCPASRKYLRTSLSSPPLVLLQWGPYSMWQDLRDRYSLER